MDGESSEDIFAICVEDIVVCVAKGEAVGDWDWFLGRAVLVVIDAAVSGGVV